MKISRRNFLAVAGAAVAAAALTACGGSSDDSAASSGAQAGDASGIEKVALCCNIGSVDDESFNQSCWEAIQSYMGDNCEYYTLSTEGTQEERETAIRQAINDGADVVVCVSYQYGEAVAWAADQYPDVKFIAVDVTKEDVGLDALPDNCYCITFKEEQAGYLAGYAVTKEGYTSLGFLGGTAVPSVIRYGYGFVQGADAAAAELGPNIEINYFYAGQFYGDANITSRMEGWYSNGTQVVFACGGGIYTSAVEAALKNNGYVVGVDVDQNYIGVNGVAKDGYTKLGFLGGTAVPAVIRYGYGYVQGIDAAAQELGTNVEVNYFYAGQFYGDANITSRMEGWYSNGTQVVFACGGGIYTSAVEAALKNDGKVVGVDVDQNYIGVKGVEDGTYAYNPFVTSAMKGLTESVTAALSAISDGAWSDIAATNGNFGLEDGNYIGLPTADDSWNFTTFTKEDYEAVRARIASGEVVVDNSSDDGVKPTVSSFTTVNYIQ